MRIAWSRRPNRKGSLYLAGLTLYEVQIGAVAQDAKLARRSIYGSLTLQGTSQVIRITAPAPLYPRTRCQCSRCLILTSRPHMLQV